MVDHDETATKRVPAAAAPTTINVEGELAAIRALDAVGLAAILRRIVARHGIPHFIERHVPALMGAVGDAWADGTVSIPQEHLASAVVLTLLLEAVRVAPADPDAPRLVTATPAGESHAIGAALAGAAAAIEGWSVVYLGADVPAGDIAAAATAAGARAVAVSVVQAAHVDATAREIRSLRKALAADIRLYVGGAGAAPAVERAGARAKSHPPLAGITLCDTVGELRTLLGRAARIGRR
jgi:methanogenic corrinoid protein MtbC1